VAAGFVGILERRSDRAAAGNLAHRPKDARAGSAAHLPYPPPRSHEEASVIRLHTAATPNGHKVSIALEELGLDYEVRRWILAEDEQKTPEFLALNPNHKIPVLEDGDLVVWESGAILLHLGERHDPEGRILPKDPGKRLEAIQYAFFQTGGVGPNLGRLGQALRKEGEKNAEMIEIFTGELDRLIEVLDRILADGREYLAGPYTIGDIMHYPWLRYPLALEHPALMKCERVVAWLQRIAEREAVKRGMAVPES